MYNDSSEIIYPGSFKRGLSAFIDVVIVFLLRVFFVQLIGKLWYEKRLLSFMDDFRTRFGTSFVGNVPEHLTFVQNHPIFWQTITFYIFIVLVGTFYHAYFNSSSWSATIGKRLTNMALIKAEGQKMTFVQALKHYFVSIIPWIFAIYIALYANYSKVDIYHAITGNIFNLIFGLISIAWLYVHIITKKKITVQDLLCKTIMINGKFGGKWPRPFWS